MAAGKHPGGGRPGRPVVAAKKSSAAGWIIALVTVVLVGGCIGIGVANRDSGGTMVPAPTANERADTVPILAQAAASQGICYGWRLESWYGSAPVSVGSNLGDEVAVVDNPSCPRWVEVVADVRYTSESSESSDYAIVRVTGSPDIDRSDLHAVETGLARFGLDSDRFVDDPGWAVCRAAVALPLLLAETGVVSPAATPSAQPGAAVSPLPAAGSDFWRDRWGWLLVIGGLLLVTALLFTVGLVQRGRQRAAASAGRTQEKA
ncbi:hypothetical protein MCAG_03004 [Micromonospora sp. ATCC 39149]|uniref:hypothetical protein n=1 Tax=Micromonospora sp. (strain ATCC 39149 / NRRL 15099 / SCC 1413) TaxID=219305 RepID=UPI0001A4FFAF|nr:hypothetical protein [Micromonospora sp. ATCC 39149]EEP72677.1 hypothetical protein MCAG_03004 [Micromonospora sp. ATCC 39149]